MFGENRAVRPSATRPAGGWCGWCGWCATACIRAGRDCGRGRSGDFRGVNDQRADPDIVQRLLVERRAGVSTRGRAGSVLLPRSGEQRPVCRARRFAMYRGKTDGAGRSTSQVGRPLEQASPGRPDRPAHCTGVGR